MHCGVFLLFILALVLVLLFILISVLVKLFPLCIQVLFLLSLLVLFCYCESFLCFPVSPCILRLPGHWCSLPGSKIGASSKISFKFLVPWVPAWYSGPSRMSIRVVPPATARERRACQQGLGSRRQQGQDVGSFAQFFWKMAGALSIKPWLSRTSSTSVWMTCYLSGRWNCWGV